jgi:hypothetical protein
MGLKPQNQRPRHDQRIPLNEHGHQAKTKKGKMIRHILDDGILQLAGVEKAKIHPHNESC